MHILFAASTSSRFLLVSSTPFIRSDGPRMFVRHGVTQPFMSIQSSHRPYCHHLRRFAFFSSSPVYFGTRYISRKTHHLIFSHTQVTWYPSFPFAPTIFIPSGPKPEQCGSLGEKYVSPFLVVFQEVFLWFGPIDCVCISVIVQLCCVSTGGSQTCTIFSACPLWYSMASIPRRDSWLDILSLLIKWTTSFSILFVTLILLNPVSRFLKLLFKILFTPYNSLQMLLRASFIRRYLPRLSTIQSHALITSSTPFVCTFFFCSFDLEVFPVLVFWSLSYYAFDQCIFVDS